MWLVGSNSRGAEGHDWWLVEEEEPFCLGDKVHRRTLWVEEASRREGLLRRTQKAWAYGSPPPLAILFKEVGEILKSVKVKCARIQASSLDCPVGTKARSVYRVVLSA